jgi:hypothetical protein
MPLPVMAAVDDATVESIAWWLREIARRHEGRPLRRKRLLQAAKDVEAMPRSEKKSSGSENNC